jgi:hypothetical protein
LAYTHLVAAESPSAGAYIKDGIPHAAVVDRQGRIAWDGHPMAPEFEAVIKAELARPAAGG